MKKYKKYSELLFHIVGWVLFILFPIYTFQMDVPGFSFTNKIISSLVFPAYFYLNLYIFVPKFLNKKKYLFFLASMIFGYLAIYSSATFLDKPKFEFRTKPVISEFRPTPPEVFKENLSIGKLRHGGGPPEAFRAMFPFLFILTTSTFIKLYQLWQKDQHLAETRERERIQSELSYLKLQMSPHFLYNSLNSIYSLAIEGSDKVANVVLKLSELTRYMTYTSEKKYVDIDEEIEHLHNFIELQRIRLIDSVVINFDYSLDNKNEKIEPMLLIPFIENAFKHGISYSTQAEIDINLNVKDHQLLFQIKNQLFEKKESKVSNSDSGIGLPNVKRRLELLYPEKHYLVITKNENEFIVELKIDLKTK